MPTAGLVLILAALLAPILHAQQTAPVAGGAPAETLDFEMFQTQVQPIFLAKREGLVRCVQCHGRGTGSGFNLQPLVQGATTWTREQAQKNFESASRFVAPGMPTASRLLMHPLGREAGGDPFHGGGRHWTSQQDPEWQILARWVNSSARRTTSTTTTLDFETYRTRVEPLFLNEREGPAGRSSCAGCHSSVATRFRLQPLSPGASAWSAEQSRQNFEVAARLITAGDPLKSRLLVHPLAQEAGGDPSHTGGKFWKTQDDPEWQVLAAWVRAAPASATPAIGTASVAPAGVKPLDFEFFKSRVQPMFIAKREGLVRCVQCHGRGGGNNFPIQPLADGAKAWTEEQSRKNFESASRLVVPGEPTASRLLMHPLARSAGGDPFHGGGKHWASQTDQEWQTLAAWVRGATLAGSSR